MTADFSPGSRLGDYVLDAYVGAGSFGIVWRGHVESSGDVVAIKLLTGALSAGDAASMRGDVEVLAATAAASSQHVVRVLGGSSQPVPFIVMEYVEGTDLAAILQAETRLSPSRTIDVGLAIADALQVLNQARIVHRDIKPANVLVDNTGVIKLTDFGVAKIVGYETITMTGQVAMTMAYAAPEVWEDDDDGDLRFGRPSHRSDLYALGILLYQCLCGVTPFRGNYGVLYRAHRERPPDLSTLPAETPASLREAIRRCLEKRQQDRPVDATETHLMLQRAAVELAEAQGTPPTTEPARFGSWLRVAPHPTLPWAWRCKHESSGVEATVEVYFDNDTDIGEELRRTVRANAKLTPLGAERIIESNRLLLRPQESWTASPPGEFQFWAAREDKHPEAATSVSARALQRGVLALDALIEAAARERIGLSLRDNLTLMAAGEIYVTRVGLAPPSEYLLEQTMAVLRALPLDADARAFLASAPDFAHLISRAPAALEAAASAQTPVAEPSDSTELICRSCHEPLKSGELICSQCGHYQLRVAEASTVLDGPSAATTRLQQATELASVSHVTGGGSRIEARLVNLGDGDYELVLTNAGARAQTLRLAVGSKHERLRVELAPEVTVSPSSTERVKVTASARSERRFGGRRRYQFTLVASGAGGNGEPPLTIEGSFEDEGSPWPMFAAAGAFALLVALIAVVSVVLLTSGGEKDAPALASGSPPEKAKQVVSGQGTPSTLPTLTAVGRVCPTTPPTNDIQRFEGCRVYEATVGDKTSFGSAFYGICSGASPLPTADKSAAEIRFEPSAAVFQLNKAPAQAVQYLNTPVRQTYVAEYDIAFDPGADLGFATRLNGRGGQSGVILTVRSRDEFLVLQWTGDSNSGDLSPRIPIPGIAKGRQATIGVAVNGTRYSVFVDGSLATEIVETRGTTNEAPYVEGIACPSGQGTLRVLGARVYEVAGATATVALADGISTAPAAGEAPPVTASPSAESASSLSAANKASAAAPGLLLAPRALPTMAAPANRSCSTTAPANDVQQFEGCRIFDGVMDGTSSTFFPRVIGTCFGQASDSTGSSILYDGGVATMSVLKPNGSTGLSPNALPRPSYVVEFDLSFDPVMPTGAVWALRGNSTASIFMSVDTDGFLNLWYWDAVKGIRTDIAPRVSIPDYEQGAESRSPRPSPTIDMLASSTERSPWMYVMAD